MLREPILNIFGRTATITDQHGATVNLSVLHLAELLSDSDFQYAVEAVENEMLATFQFQEID